MTHSRHGGGRSCGFNRCDDRQLLVPRRGAYSSAPVLNNLVRNIPTPTSDVRDLARRPTASNWALNFLTFSAVRDIFAVRTNRPRPCSLRGALEVSAMTEDNKKVVYWTGGILAIIVVALVVLWWAGVLTNPMATQ